jgi:ATP-dependent protease HslVU (ClpYQ) peptidase subunit
MTCCAAIIDNDGSIWVGADSAATSSEIKRLYNHPKKVFINSDFIFGFSGSFRPGQLLQYKFDPPSKPKNMDIYEFINTIFIDALKECFAENDYNINDLEKKLLDNDFLIGYKSRVFVINNDYHISEMLTNYAAIGSGAETALGSLYSTRKWDDCEERLIEALEASTYYNPSVSPPFNILKL